MKAKKKKDVCCDYVITQAGREFIETIGERISKVEQGFKKISNDVDSLHNRAQSSCYVAFFNSIASRLQCIFNRKYIPSKKARDIEAKLCCGGELTRGELLFIRDAELNQVYCESICLLLPESINNLSTIPYSKEVDRLMQLHRKHCPKHMVIA